MSFEDNPMDDRYELDQCVDEIKSLKQQLADATAAERDRILLIVSQVRSSAFASNSFLNSETAGMVAACDLIRDAVIRETNDGK